MNVLLTTLNSKFIHSSPAVLYLGKAVLDCMENRRGFDFCVREFTINNSDEHITNEIIAGKYDVVCFSCYIWNIEKTLHICENLKKAVPEIKIILGGPEVSFDAEKILENMNFIDFVLCGEGEETLPALILQLFEEKMEGNKDNVARKVLYGGCVDEKSVVFPYDDKDEIEENKIIYYETSRGCPYNCSYCMSSVDKTLRAFPMERVKSELDFFIKKKPKQVKFLDRTFNWSALRAAEIFEFLMENDNGTTNFHFEISAEIMTDELIRLVSKARAGLFQFEIGVQSTNPKTLKAVDRSADTKKLLANVRKLMKAGNIHIHVDLIAGLPYEDIKSFAKSFNEVYEVEADALQLGFLKLLKGTKIRREAERYGYVFDRTAPYQIIRNDFLSAYDIVKLKQIEHVLDDFYNKGGFFGGLRYAIGFFGNAFDFYDAFSDFYFREGYQNFSHKKEDNYRIFARFGEEVMGKGNEMREILYEDLKMRMNSEAVKRFDKKGWSIK